MEKSRTEWLEQGAKLRVKVQRWQDEVVIQEERLAQEKNDLKFLINLGYNDNLLASDREDIATRKEMLKGAKKLMLKYQQELSDHERDGWARPGHKYHNRKKEARASRGLRGMRSFILGQKCAELSNLEYGPEVSDGVDEADYAAWVEAQS
jgi:hypothetical protein